MPCALRCSLLAGAAVALVGCQRGGVSQAAEPLATLPSAGVSQDGGSASHPSLARAPDGTLFLAWLRWSKRGDDVFVASRPPGAGAWTPARRITPEAGELVRPVIAASADGVFCLWSAARPGGVAAIWYSRLEGAGWSAPARLLPDETRPHLNPEVVAGSGGVAVVYQLHDGRYFHIALARWQKRGRWSASGTLSSGDGNDWDPVAAFDAHGTLHVLWSAFRDGDYDVWWRRVEGTRLPPAQRLSTAPAHNLHPSVAIDRQGRVFAAWDVLDIPSHGSSGPSTITGANLRRRPADRSQGHDGVGSTIDVRWLDGDVARQLGDPAAEIVAPPGFLFGHGALPRVAVGDDGVPWVIYRALHREGEPREWLFWWDVLARPFRDGRWGDPLRLDGSDGFLEEPTWVATPQAVLVAFTTEHRRARAERPAADAGAAPGDHSRDLDVWLGWHGDVRTATLPAGQRSGPVVAHAAPAPSPRAAPPQPSGHYAVTVDGKRYRLLWGDTHRHSNISRCSEGGEPTPDDLYRYGEDVDRYDFFALSDHYAGNLSDESWWRELALADLFQIPGALSVLYDFEWTMRFPSGHHNVIFAARPSLEVSEELGLSPTVDQGWAVLSSHGLRALTIPHTSADAHMGTDWSRYDERYERLVEVFQACRGSYEHEGAPRQWPAKNRRGFYWGALERGHHVGAIASSDHGWGVSYACVYAEENTPDAVFDALWNRRAYGATAYGIVVDVRSGSHWMGEVWSQREAPAIDIYVRGSAPLRSIEVIGRSRVLKAFGDLGHPLGVGEARLRFVDPDWAQQTSEQWYYVRVIQSDDEMAWSSPIWVTRSPLSRRRPAAP